MLVVVQDHSDANALSHANNNNHKHAHAGQLNSFTHIGALLVLRHIRSRRTLHALPVMGTFHFLIYNLEPKH